jgi:hypothetical protein
MEEAVPKTKRFYLAEINNIFLYQILNLLPAYKGIY